MTGVDATPRKNEAIGDWLVVGIGALTTIAVLWLFREHPLTAIALAAVLLVSTLLAVIDFRVHRLPNRIVGPLAGAVAVWILAAGLIGDDMGRAWRALGFGVLAVVILLMANVAGGLGMGDVKYGFPMAATVGWFGLDPLVVTMMATTLAGAIGAVVVLLRSRTRAQQLAYGPYMALGLAAGLISAGLG